MSQPGGGRPTVRAALHFADPLRVGAPRIEPASYETIEVHNTCELMVRVHIVGC